MTILAHYDVDCSYYNDLVGIELKREPREGIVNFTLLRAGVPANNCPKYTVKKYDSVDDIYAFATQLNRLILNMKEDSSDTCVDVDMLHLKIY
jgi:hypothetical protein